MHWIYKIYIFVGVIVFALSALFYKYMPATSIVTMIMSIIFVAGSYLDGKDREKLDKNNPVKK
ncbi:hypothetical protein D3C74_380330 [compost metagenome]